MLRSVKGGGGGFKVVVFIENEARRCAHGREATFVVVLFWLMVSHVGLVETAAAETHHSMKWMKTCKERF